MANEDREWLHVQISKTMHKELHREAARQKTTISMLVRNLLEEGLALEHVERGAAVVRQVVAKELEPVKMMLRKVGEFSGVGAWEAFRVLQLLTCLCNQEGSGEPYPEDYAEKILYDSALRAKVDFYSRHRIGAGSYEEYDDATETESAQEHDDGIPKVDRALIDNEE